MNQSRASACAAGPPAARIPITGSCCTHVRRLKPSHDLECGSRISSAVICLALRHNLAEGGHKGLLTSMEELECYHAQIVDIFPARLRDFVNFRLSNRVVKSYGSMQGVCYESVPSHPYGFVFVDGPNPRSPITGEKLFNSDFVDVVQTSEVPVAGIVDQRITTLWALKKLLPTASIHDAPTKALTFVEGAKQKDLLLPVFETKSSRAALGSRSSQDNGPRE